MLAYCQYRTGLLMPHAYTYQNFESFLYRNICLLPVIFYFQEVYTGASYLVDTITDITEDYNTIFYSFCSAARAWPLRRRHSPGIGRQNFIWLHTISRHNGHIHVLSNVSQSRHQASAKLVTILEQEINERGHDAKITTVIHSALGDDGWWYLMTSTYWVKSKASLEPLEYNTQHGVIGRVNFDNTYIFRSQ